MRTAGVKGFPVNKRARSKYQTPTATDLVDRIFTRDKPNKLWVTDITEHPTPWILAIVATPVTTSVATIAGIKSISLLPESARHCHANRKV